MGFIFLLNPLVNGLRKGIFIIILDVLLLGLYELSCFTPACQRQAGHDPYHLKRIVRQFDAPGIFRIHDDVPDPGHLHPWGKCPQKGFQHFRHHIHHIVPDCNPEAVFLPLQAHALAPHGNNPKAPL